MKNKATVGMDIRGTDLTVYNISSLTWSWKITQHKFNCFIKYMYLVFLFILNLCVFSFFDFFSLGNIINNNLCCWSIVYEFELVICSIVRD